MSSNIKKNVEYSKGYTDAIKDAKTVIKGLIKNNKLLDHV